jgi:hypothetical protein
MARPDMPTTNSLPFPVRQPPRRMAWVVVVLIGMLALLYARYHQPLVAQAEAGTAYGARTACSCRHIGGRDLLDCEKDFEDGMALVMLSEDAKAGSVTARVPLLSSTTATYRAGWGCLLEPYQR